MPFWTDPFKVRRSVRLFSHAVKQNDMLLQTGGEVCYLLKRMVRANYNFQKQGNPNSKDTTGTDRRVAYIEKSASSFTTDPDTGDYRYKLWEEGDSQQEYPDIGTLTATVQVSGGSASVWEAALDKYSFITDRTEYAFDIFQDQLDSTGSPITDAVYIVFNTPPFSSENTVAFTFGNISPAVDFTTMQPKEDGESGFQNTLFGYDQWLDANKKVRRRSSPNAFLVAFPGILSDFSLTEGGLLRQVAASFWTTAPPYSPEISEHDVVVRKSTGQRFQVTNYTPIYVEDQLLSQHFDLVEFDPRSSIYDFEVSES